MAYKRIPPGTINKEKLCQVFDFPNIGHKVTIYMNVYHNVPVSHVFFYENLAACLQTLASEALKKSENIRKRLKDEDEVIGQLKGRGEPVMTKEEEPRGL